MTAGEDFWLALDALIGESELVIDRPKDSRHPRYPDFVYALDYGYLKGTTSADGAGIDVWRGSGAEQICDAVICTVDLVKQDSEIKLLIGCTEAEKSAVLQFHNQTASMKGIMFRRM